jgi:RNA polymerase sigma factor for flagellar operon FliA
VDAEEEGLWLAYRDNPTAAVREKLILRYAPLVKYVAGRMAVGMPSHVERADLTSYGMFGLMDAIEKFDVDTGYRFQTYAVQRIRGAIVDELRSMDWVPRSVRRKAREMEKAIARFQNQHGRPPEDPELAEELGISMEKLADNLAQVSMTSVGALDAALTGSDGHRLRVMDTVADQDAVLPDEHIDEIAMRELLRHALDKLTDREQKVLALYYFEGLTLAQIGDIIGVTESRVSQIHSKAILTLRSRIERAATA